MKLRSAFQLAANDKRPALVAYLTFGDPDVPRSIDVI